jgi:hypothetical protein
MPPGLSNKIHGCARLTIENQLSGKYVICEKNNLPLYVHYVMKHRPKLFSGGQRQCRSWKKALIAAGIKIPKYAVGGRIGILKALHDLDGHSANDVPQRLK